MTLTDLLPPANTRAIIYAKLRMVNNCNVRILIALYVCHTNDSQVRLLKEESIFQSVL